MKKDIFHIINIEPMDMKMVFLYSKNPEKDLSKHLNAKKNKVVSKWLNKAFGGNIPIGDGQGGVIRTVSNNRPYILYLKNQGKKDWNFFETIIHETHHLVEDMATFYQFESEKEFKAYLQEHLFRKFRRLVK